MSLIHLALVAQSRRVRRGEASQVAAALQRQISRDFAPLWGVDATIDAFAALDEVPPGYWPIIVRDALPQRGVVGIHLDDRGQPFSLVQYSQTWSLTASHEVLEMVADPQGNRLMPGGSLKRGQGIVEFLIEVCDPCGAPEFAYTVNGILVSDFITPHYYDPRAVPGVRYSFSGALDRPRGLLPGGYVARREPITGEWWRAFRTHGGRALITSLGPRLNDGRPLRERIDEDNTLTFLYDGVPLDDPSVIAASARYESSTTASRAQATQLHAQIERLILQAAARSAAPRADPGRERRRQGRPPPVRLEPIVTRGPAARPGEGPHPDDRRTRRTPAD